MKGDFGESFANIHIGQWTSQGQLFETTLIGGKWPTIDIYAEARSLTGQRIFCFFQVKSTELGYTKEGRLKIQFPKKKLNELSNFHAPTYLVGVDYNKKEPQMSTCYVKIIRGVYSKGITGMETTFPLRQDSLILLRDEIDVFWTTVNPLGSKLTYTTNF